VTGNRLLKILVIGVGLVYVLIFVFAATKRLFYPFEVEWNEGAILDHAIRLLNGKPIYTAPSLTFAPFVYTPLYYWIIALVMKVGGIGLWAGRAISIASTLATAYLIGRIVQRETTSRFLVISSVALYIAFYRATGFFYDIVRMDALAVLLAIAAIYSALYLRHGEILSAVFIVLAYITKQQMIAVWPALAFWFILIDRRRAITFCTISVSLLVAQYFVLNWLTDGWYRFYTTTIPGVKASKLFSWNDALQFFPQQFFGTFAVTTVVILVYATLRITTLIKTKDRTVAILLCWVLTIFSGAISLGNSGGYVNVLMPMTALTAMLLPIASHIFGHDLLKRPSVVAPILLATFVSLFYNPFQQRVLVPCKGDEITGNKVIASLSAISGDVWIPFHGYLSRLSGKQPHIHFMAMNDALIVGDSTSRRFQQEIDSAFVRKQFSAIILDDDSVFKWRSIPHYKKAGTLTSEEGFVSRIGDAPTRPNLIYRPSNDR
jgi:hypothetical protein